MNPIKYSFKTLNLSAEKQLFFHRTPKRKGNFKAIYFSGNDEKTDNIIN